MRNLKRALSLALAAAMLIGMMVVGASAEYKDQDAVSKAEAVQLLSDLGIVGGDQNGNFNPTATLTRAEFTVMMANALTGCNFDATLFDGASTPFTDIKGHWAAPYIAYCYSASVIAGTSATTFSPDSTLTAAQAAAILLSALGYNRNGEFAANGQFALNVTSIAQKEGLYKDLSVAANAGVSRENVAQMIKNALFMNTKEYLAVLQIYQDEDPIADALFKNLRAVKGTLTAYGDDKQTTINNGSVAVSSSAADIGTPVVYYRNDDGLVSTVAVADKGAVLLATVTDGTNYQVLTAPRGSANYDKDKFVAAEDTNVVYIVDGVSSIMSDVATAATKGNTLELYDLDDNGKIDLAKVTTYKADKVTGDVKTKTVKGELQVTVPGVTTGYVAADTVKGYENLAKDDIVLTTTDANGIITIVKAESVTGKVTAIANGKYTVNGTAYSVSGITDASIQVDTNNPALKDEVIFYLDKAGYVIAAEKVSGESLYAVALDADDPTMAGQQVRLMTADGKVAVVTVSKLQRSGQDSATAVSSSNQITKGGDTNLYTYTVNDDNTYTLKYKEAVSGVTAINKNNATLDSNVFATANTTFVIYNSTDKVATVYTGIANVPTVTSATTQIVKGTDGKTVTLVFAKAEAANIDNSSSNSATIYVTSTAYGTVLAADGKTTLYVYSAIKDGEVTTVTAKSDVFSSVTNYTVNSVDEDGNIVSATPNTIVEVSTKKQVEYFNGNSMVVATGWDYDGAGSDPAITSFQVNDKTQYFTIDTKTGLAYDKTAEAADASDIEAGTTQVVVIPDKDNKNIAKTVIIVKDSTTASVPTISAQPTAGSLSVTASVTDGGALTYQWYENNVAMSGATTSSITANATPGTYTYYCIVTNTLNGTTATARTNTVTVVVA